MNKVSLTFLILLVLTSSFSFKLDLTYGSDPSLKKLVLTDQNPGTNALRDVVNNYHQGFIDEDFDLVRNSIGSQLIMINGNYSGNTSDWQAHQFLANNEIDEWIKMMLDNAAPFENKLDVKNINERNNSALVSVEEKGKNKFRSWDLEEVAYMMGKINNEWKIVGIFIKNIKNPE